MSSARKSGQKLIIDLVPGTMWGKNVRAVVSIEVWDTLRWNFGATWAKPHFPRFRISDGHNIRSNAACGGCGVQVEEMELHEVWKYDDEKLIQKLDRLVPMCRKSHLVLHMGRAKKVGQGDEAMTHLGRFSRVVNS